MPRSSKPRKPMKAKKTEYKIIIGVPSGSHWAAEFGVSLAVMMSYAAQVKIAPDAASQHILVNNIKGSILPQMRQEMIDYALKQKATHILFVDSDMQFPRDTLHRLLKWQQMIVAANCCTKKFPTTTTARINPENRIGGDPVFSQGKVGIQRVWRVGTGVMLLNLRAFERLERPYFSLKWSGDKADAYVGEDWALCENFENAGIPIFIDHELSEEIGHIGTFNYNLSCVVSEEEEQRVREALAG